jgi:hypothetical protein
MREPSNMLTKRWSGGDRLRLQTSLTLTYIYVFTAPSTVVRVSVISKTTGTYREMTVSSDTTKKSLNISVPLTTEYHKTRQNYTKLKLIRANGLLRVAAERIYIDLEGRSLDRFHIN